MNPAGLSLREHTTGQLRKLCEVVGFDEANDTPIRLLHDVLGAAGDRPLHEPPLWPSDVADDMTPIEFSIAFGKNGAPTLRVLGETIAERPNHAANLDASRQLLDSLADRFQLSLDRFHAVQDLFLPDEPQGKFTMWFSFVLRPNFPPAFKIYFNPEVRGIAESPQLIEEGLKRLGLAEAYPTVTEYAFRRGDLDRFSFFALDLHADSKSRVKVYVSHHSAEIADAERAGSPGQGVDPERIRDFCKLTGGGNGPFMARPLVSSYSFVEGDADRPSNYTLHMPVRDYVNDDESARTRALHLMAQHGLDPTMLDRALAAISTRPLRSGVGLIAYLSLRLGTDRPGMTAYFSSEAYGTAPPRSRWTVADGSLPRGRRPRAGRFGKLRPLKVRKI